MTNTDHDMVTREIHIMNLLLLHPNIVTLKETFENAETFHLVMDLCTCGELLDRMKQKRRYTEREATIAIRDIAEGIKVLHRDLKPKNLMYVDDNDGSTLKIIDF
uniref:Protein kinase domain-containing protein n=1 Tax=Helianthus annuus TaxID=4232 RepID=A0A251VQ72_HELAN